MPDDPDADAILDRRRRLIALALSGLLPLTGCDAIVGPCLEPPIQRPLTPPGPCLSAPMPCLSEEVRPPPDDPPEPEGPALPEEDEDPPAGGAVPCLAPPPQPCLTVARDPEEE